MKRIVTLLVMLGLAVSIGGATITHRGDSAFASRAQGSPAGLVLYDNFDEQFLSILKWSLFPVCFNSTALECVREIQDGKARLAVRNYGLPTDNVTVQYEPSELHFTNPASIRTIAAQFVVLRTSSMGCPANTAGLPNATRIPCWQETSSIAAAEIQQMTCKGFWPSITRR